MQPGVFGAAWWVQRSRAFQSAPLPSPPLPPSASPLSLSSSPWTLVSPSTSDQGKCLLEVDGGAFPSADGASQESLERFWMLRSLCEPIGPPRPSVMERLHADDFVALRNATRDRSGRVRKPSTGRGALCDGDAGSSGLVVGPPPGGRRWTVLDMHSLGHVMWTTAGLLWCRNCGHHTSKVPQKPLEKCVPNSKAYNLRWLLQGKHPDSKKELGRARPLFQGVSGSVCTGTARL